MSDAAAGAGVGGRTRITDAGVAATLLIGAMLGWWWSARMAGETDAMSGGSAMGSMAMGDAMSMTAFLVGWIAMMAAMMFPAVFPVVRLYARAAGRRAVAPLPFFVLGYLTVWGSIGVPAYFAWRAWAGPLDEGAPWVGRWVGIVLVAAAAYQLTPFKRACLRHCRSPVSLFTHASGNPRRPSVALRIGATHGAVCLGCCWALMAVLVAVGTMHIAWMAALSLAIFLEKISPRGPTFAVVVALVLAVVGGILLVEPSTLSSFT